MNELILFLILQTIEIAAPIMITAVGACFSEITGVVNIGLEGIMLCGAFAATAITLATGNPYLGVLGGMLAGGLISLIHGYISVTLRGNQIVSGVAINLFALSVTSFLIKALYGAAGTTPAVSVLANETIVLVFMYFLALVAWVVIFKTVFGLRMRSVGEHPLAADTVGINVQRTRILGVFLSGIYGGLGGAFLTTVMLPSFNNGMSAGRGFIALAALIFGKWNPIGAIMAALLFALGQVLADQAKLAGTGVPQQFWSMIPYVLTLVALVGFVGKSKAPKASGIPYDK